MIKSLGKVLVVAAVRGWTFVVALRREAEHLVHHDIAAASIIDFLSCSHHVRTSCKIVSTAMMTTTKYELSCRHLLLLSHTVLLTLVVRVEIQQFLIF